MQLLDLDKVEIKCPITEEENLEGPAELVAFSYLLLFPRLKRFDLVSFLSPAINYCQTNLSYDGTLVSPMFCLNCRTDYGDHSSCRLLYSCRRCPSYNHWLQSSPILLAPHLLSLERYQTKQHYILTGRYLRWLKNKELTSVGLNNSR